MSINDTNIATADATNAANAAVRATWPEDMLHLQKFFSGMNFHDVSKQLFKKVKTFDELTADIRLQLAYIGGDITHSDVDADIADAIQFYFENFDLNDLVMACAPAYKSFVSKLVAVVFAKQSEQDFIKKYGISFALNDFDNGSASPGIKMPALTTAQVVINGAVDVSVDAVVRDVVIKEPKHRQGQQQQHSGHGKHGKHGHSRQHGNRSDNY